ncbi:heme-binding protein, partial [Enterococcus casseliflavus]|uniref:heme-binding protein n=1 Tax=Enterococcus casseliflavus TaxID=37734 RepID=UPI003D0A1605
MSTLTLAQANALIAAALDASRQAGYKPMAVVVLDAAGHLKAAQREDDASMFR